MKHFGYALLTLLLAGCGNEFLLERSGAGDNDVFENGACTKIEGSAIGVDQTLAVGTKTIRFHSWVAKAGEPGEFMGFSIETSGALVTRVKAGGETYPVTSESWANPVEDGSAVSNVESCDPDSDPNDDPDNDDDTDSPGDDPDSGGDDPDSDPNNGDPI